MQFRTGVEYHCVDMHYMITRIKPTASQYDLKHIQIWPLD